MQLAWRFCALKRIFYTKRHHGGDVSLCLSGCQFIYLSILSVSPYVSVFLCVCFSISVCLSVCILPASPCLSVQSCLFVWWSGSIPSVSLSSCLSAPVCFFVFIYHNFCLFFYRMQDLLHSRRHTTLRTRSEGKVPKRLTTTAHTTFQRGLITLVCFLFRYKSQ